MALMISPMIAILLLCAVCTLAQQPSMIASLDDRFSRCSSTTTVCDGKTCTTRSPLYFGYPSLLNNTAVDCSGLKVLNVYCTLPTNVTIV